MALEEGRTQAILRNLFSQIWSILEYWRPLGFDPYNFLNADVPLAMAFFGCPPNFGKDWLLRKI